MFFRFTGKIPGRHTESGVNVYRNQVFRRTLQHVSKKVASDNHLKAISGLHAIVSEGSEAFVFIVRIKPANTLNTRIPAEAHSRPNPHE